MAEFFACTNLFTMVQFPLVTVVFCGELRLILDTLRGVVLLHP